MKAMMFLERDSSKKWRDEVYIRSLAWKLDMSKILCFPLGQSHLMQEGAGISGSGRIRVVVSATLID